MPVASFVNLSGTTTADVSSIALGLRQWGYAAQYRDANGNLQLGGGRWIKFDYENRPIRIITPDGTVTDYAYDFEGSRVRQTVSSGTQTLTSSLYIGQIHEITNGTTIQYITAASMRVAMKTSSGNLFYYLPDHLGSANLLVNSSLSNVRNNQYDPFGGFYNTTGTQDSDYKFTGQRFDSKPALYYYGARYYDPLLSQFVTPDTLIQSPYDPQTLNRFTYCRNNPIVFNDPTGHSFLGDIFKGNPLDLTLRAINPISWVTSTPMGWRFTEQHPSEMAAIGLGVLTAGAGTEFGGISGFTDAALQGEIFGGSLNEISGEDAFHGALEGGVTATLAHTIDLIPGEGFGSVASRIALGGTLGGLSSRLHDQSFIQGFALATAFASTAEGYRYFAGEAPAASGGKELEKSPNGAQSYYPNEKGQPPPGFDVAGYNRPANFPGECVQGSACGMRINSFPGGNAIAAFHDTWMNRLEQARGSVGYWTNRLTMIPSALATGAALLGTDWSYVTQEINGRKR